MTLTSFTHGIHTEFHPRKCQHITFFWNWNRQPDMKSLYLPRADPIIPQSSLTLNYWHTHINNATAIASSTLGFIRRRWSRQYARTWSDLSWNTNKQLPGCYVVSKLPVLLPLHFYYKLGQLSLIISAVHTYYRSTQPHCTHILTAIAVDSPIAINL